MTAEHPPAAGPPGGDPSAEYPEVLPLATPEQPVHYVIIDDEPRYRIGLGTTAEAHPDIHLEQAGGYCNVESFLAVHQRPCHVIVLDLCLNRQTGDTAVLHGVRAIHHLAKAAGHRVLVYTADPRPEPVARCVAAGAVGFVSKYDDPGLLARAVAEIGRQGYVHSPILTAAILHLVDQCHDIRLSETQEQTLVLLDRGMTEQQIARHRNLSPRTIEDHKRKILERYGAEMEKRRYGYAELTHQLGIAPGDIVNDAAGHKPARGLIHSATAWVRKLKH